MESNQNSLERYQRTQMRKENIIEKLRERGCRITKQRQILLDVILKEECSCCKEIYYKAARRDSKIGMATVYRMMNMLEEIGCCQSARNVQGVRTSGAGRGMSGGIRR